MDRRSFFKFLGIGAVAAAVAPKILAEQTPEVYPEASAPITFEMLQRAYGETLRFPRGNHGLTVYEEPLAGYDNSIGVDVGSGFGYSPTCVSVMRKGNESEPDIQVAELVSNRLNPSQIAPIVASIAWRYGEKCKDHRGPMLVIEQISSPGDLCQNQLKIMGFTRFYSMKKYTPMKTKTVKDGWYSTTWSLPVLMSRFEGAVKDGWYKPKSDRLKFGIGNPETTIRNDSIVRSAAQSYIGLNGTNEVKNG